MHQDFSKQSLELLYDISQELTSSLDLHTIISRILHLSTKNVGAERGSIIVLNKSQEPIEAAIVYGDRLIPHASQQAKDTLKQGLAGWVVWNREAALVPDTSQDVRWLLRPDDSEERSGSKSAICLPLSARDELVGVLTIVHPQPMFFNQEHYDLLKSIADMAGSAINNAVLYEEVQSLSHRYRELFEDSIDAILLTDRQGKIIQANRQATQTSKSSLKGLLESSIFNLHAMDNEALGKDFSNLAQGNTITYESHLISTNQSEISPIEVHVRQVIIDGKEYFQWILRDITERKALDNMREDLTAMVYHDLRSPLSNIITSLELMDSMVSEKKDDNLQIVLNVINRSVERVQRLVNSILDIHRLEANQPITRKEDVILTDLIREVSIIVQPTVENKHQNIEMNIQDKIPVLKLDADMFKRVMINLIENAVKYSPQNGSIMIGGRQDDHNVTIWVQDSGPGIPPESRDAIFNKFIRLQSNIMPKGIGLGLAFCKLAVEAHGGKIWVEGNQGSGSRFMISLPIQFTP